MDNHGKEVGGYGQNAPTKYRSHALQAPTTTGETVTFVPLGETNNMLRYYTATEMKVVSLPRAYGGPDPPLAAAWWRPPSR